MPAIDLIHHIQHLVISICYPCWCAFKLKRRQNRNVKILTLRIVLAGFSRIHFNIKDHDTQIGASIGISVYPEHGNDKELLLKKADDAMYLAKKEGKNDCRM